MKRHLEDLLCCAYVWYGFSGGIMSFFLFRKAWPISLRSILNSRWLTVVFSNDCLVDRLPRLLFQMKSNEIKCNQTKSSEFIMKAQRYKEMMKRCRIKIVELACQFLFLKIHTPLVITVPIIVMTRAYRGNATAQKTVTSFPFYFFFASRNSSCGWFNRIRNSNSHAWIKTENFLEIANQRKEECAIIPFVYYQKRWPILSAKFVFE